jgi:hypothetical protein
LVTWFRREVHVEVIGKAELRKPPGALIDAMRSEISRLRWRRLVKS